MQRGGVDPPRDETGMTTRRGGVDPPRHVETGMMTGSRRTFGFFGECYGLITQRFGSDAEGLRKTNKKDLASTYVLRLRIT